MNTKLLELIAEIRRISNDPRRATHIGFLWAMAYACLRTAEKDQLLTCLETIVKARAQ